MLRINWKWGLVSVWLLLPVAGCQWLGPLARASWSGLHRYLRPPVADRPKVEITAEIARLRQASEQLTGEAAGRPQEIYPGGAHATIYERLNICAATFGVSVLLIKPLPLQPQNGFQILTIELRLEAEFTRLLRFLYAVEQENSGLRIQTLTLQSAQIERINAALTIRAFLQ